MTSFTPYVVGLDTFTQTDSVLNSALPYKYPPFRAYSAEYANV